MVDPSNNSSSLLEWLKIIATLAGGGLAGAVLTAFLQKRRSRLQRLTLLERVNRKIDVTLKGIVLARVLGQRLEVIENVREYQLSLRNNTARHLRDAEVQFEFPAIDVQAWTSAPVLSKTPLIPMNTTAGSLGRSAYRWKIPRFPSGDSVEFTFQAVEPSSDKFEAVLYGDEGIILEVKSNEESSEEWATRLQHMERTMFLVPGFALILLLITYLHSFFARLLQLLIK
jgi:hypothetical protein